MLKTMSKFICWADDTPDPYYEKSYSISNISFVIKTGFKHEFAKTISWRLFKKLQSDSVCKKQKAYFYFSGYALFYCILSFSQWVTFKKKEERNENSIPFFKLQTQMPTPPLELFPNIPVKVIFLTSKHHILGFPTEPLEGDCLIYCCNQKLLHTAYVQQKFSVPDNS